MTKNSENKNYSARSIERQNRIQLQVDATVDSDVKSIKSGKSIKSTKFLGRTKSKSPSDQNLLVATATIESTNQDDAEKIPRETTRSGRSGKKTPRRSAKNLRSSDTFIGIEPVRSTPEFDDFSFQGLTSISIKILQSKNYKL